MKMTFLKSTILATALLGVAAVTAAAQNRSQERGLRCDDNSRGDRASNCAIKEMRIPATASINIDGGQNGGASVRGDDREDIFVRAKIQTYADSDAQAKELAGQIRIETNGGSIRAEGPVNDGKQQWAVSYEILVPRRSDVSVKTHNGGISFSDVRGRIEFEAQNGGVSLQRLAGAVHGRTRNGGLSIDLAGDRWDGEGLDVSTTNGGISLTLPENYSAQLETSTVNGGLKVDFPVTVQGRIDRELSLNLGSGGARVRAVTTNGGVSVRRKG
jgi:DUF4097 and DUF4098 domain-containing protein YvlB